MFGCHFPKWPALLHMFGPKENIVPGESYKPLQIPKLFCVKFLAKVAFYTLEVLGQIFNSTFKV